MKKRMLPLLLTLALLFQISAAAVSAAPFVRTRHYAGQFSDLTAASPFYENISALYEYGLSVGKPDGTFGIQDAVTVGQVAIFAARIRSLYDNGDAETGANAFRAPGQSTAAPYLLYLRSAGVLGQEEVWQETASASRAVVAHLLANTLPAAQLPAINQETLTQGYASRKFLRDVTEYTLYYQDILTLYRAGISQGSDASGSFHPSAAISRGALAAMLTRMVDSSLRLTLRWDVSGSSIGELSWSDLIPSGSAAYVPAPASEAEYAADAAYMFSTGSNSLALCYGPSLSAVKARRVMEAMLSAVKTYAEQCYNSVSCTMDISSGTMVLSFSAAGATDTQLTAYRSYTLSAAIAVHDQLWTSGSITAEMSEYEKARVYYDWICQNCAYDYSAGDSSLSHIPYALFHDGTAVCDGYTGAYNLLLKLEGISCRGLSNASHIWTVATLDGTEYHIDTTWGDSSGYFTDYTYFAMTPAQSWSVHTW